MPARVPAIHAETAVKQNPGVLSLVDELVVPNLGQLAPDDRARLERAIAAARDAVGKHQHWLEKELHAAARRASSASAANSTTRSLHSR